MKLDLIKKKTKTNYLEMPVVLIVVTLPFICLSTAFLICVFSRVVCSVSPSRLSVCCFLPVRVSLALLWLSARAPGACSFFRAVAPAPRCNPPSCLSLSESPKRLCTGSPRRGFRGGRVWFRADRRKRAAPPEQAAGRCCRARGAVSGAEAALSARGSPAPAAAVAVCHLSQAVMLSPAVKAVGTGVFVFSERLLPVRVQPGKQAERRLPVSWERKEGAVLLTAFALSPGLCRQARRMSFSLSSQKRQHGNC